MSLFSFKHLHVENFRCFDGLDLSLEGDLTVLFAENAGGRSALLTALAMGLAVIQRGSPNDTRPNAAREGHQQYLVWHCSRVFRRIGS
jgi:predicted ATP-dependent endonuclease of OLD family